MPSSTLKASIHNHFGFLSTRYGYSISEEHYGQEMGNAIVIFTRPPAMIELVKDRGQILLQFGDIGLNRSDWIDFASTVQLLSGRPDPVYSFPAEDNADTDDLQIVNLSSILQQHCAPILTGAISIMQLRDTMRLRRENELQMVLSSFKGKPDLENDA